MINSYNGVSEYAFISYSHKNREDVEKMLNEFQNFGIKFWYDENIEPGINYSDKIAKKILSSFTFFAFLSNDYFESDYCKNELQYALRKGIPVICFCLENELQIPASFDMQLCQNQLVQITKYKSRANMLSSMINSLPKELFDEEGITLCKPTDDTRIYIVKKEFADGDMEIIRVVLSNNRLNTQKVLCQFGKELFWELGFSVSPNMSPSSQNIIRYGIKSDNTYKRNYYLSVYSQKVLGRDAGTSCFEIYSIEISSEIVEENDKISETNFSAELKLLKRYTSLYTATFFHEINYGTINANSNNDIEFKDIHSYEKYPEDMKLMVNYPNGKNKEYIVRDGLPQATE